MGVPSPKGPVGHLSAPRRLEWSPHTHRRTFATVAKAAGDACGSRGIEEKSS